MIMCNDNIIIILLEVLCIININVWNEVMWLMWNNIIINDY